MGEIPRRRIVGQRTVEEDAHVHAKKERTECTDLSLACPLPEASQSASIDTELRLRLRRKRSIVPWPASSGEKCSLEVDEGKQQKKQCTSGRDEQVLSRPPQLLDGQDEILWCELLNPGESVIEEWSDENEDHHGATTEQLVQGVAKKGNERGATAHRKSLIWAAKDTEWRKLEGKGAVCMLTGESAEKAKAQFADRFIPSRFVVTRPSPDEFKARWCLRGYLDPDVTELMGSGSTQSPTVSKRGRMLSCQMIDCEQWLISATGRHSWCLPGGRCSGQKNKDHCTRVFPGEESQECGMDPLSLF